MNNDLISRQAAFEPYQTLDDSDTICIWLLRKNIEQLPSAQPEVTEEAVKEYCHKRGFTILTSDFFNELIGMQKLDIQLAYQRGRNDGIEECTELVKRFNNERK